MGEDGGMERLSGREMDGMVYRVVGRMDNGNGGETMGIFGWGKNDSG